MATETEDCSILICCPEGLYTYTVETDEPPEVIDPPLALIAGPGVYVYGQVQDYPTHVATSWDLQMSDNIDGPWVDTGSVATSNDGENGLFEDDPNFGKYFRLRFHTDTGTSEWSTNAAFK